MYWECLATKLFHKTKLDTDTVGGKEASPAVAVKVDWVSTRD